MIPGPLRRVLSAALLVALFLLASGTAAAHGYQVGGDPEPFATVEEPPLRVVVHMSEPVEAQFSRIHVYDATGRDLAIGSTSYAEGNESRLTVDVGVPGNGTYTVSWEARWRSDGHDTKGSYGFAVGNGTTTNFTTGVIEGGYDAPGLGEIALRAGLFTGALLVVGSLAFLVTNPDLRLPLTRDRAILLAIAGAHLVLAATFIILLQQTASGYRTTLLGAFGNLPQAIELTYLARVLAARILLGIALLAGLLAVLRYGTRIATTGAAALGVALLPTLSLTSHAASVPANRALVLAADAAHVLAAGVWIGGLPLLALALVEARRRSDPDAAAAVSTRFSRLALGAVVLVTITGTYTAFEHLHGDPSRLVGTLYGRFLLAKIALVAALIGFGAYNQRVLVPRTRHGDPRAARRLTRSALLEVGVAFLVVVAAGGLTAASPEPPQPVAAPADGPVVLTEEGRDVNATLTLTPGRVGTNDLNVTFTILENGTRLDYAKKVIAYLNHQDRDLGTASVRLEPQGDGTYAARASLGLPGEWKITLLVQRPDAYDDAVEFTLNL